MPSGPEDVPVDVLSTDAEEWAETFMACVDARPGLTVDVPTMTAWFACAIEAGRRAA